MEKFHKDIISTYAPHSKIFSVVQVNDIIMDSVKLKREELKNVVIKGMTMKMAEEISKRPYRTMERYNAEYGCVEYLQEYWVFTQNELENIIDAAWDAGERNKKTLGE